MGSAVFLLIAPGILAGWIPWRISRWYFRGPLFGGVGSRVVGGLLIAIGLPVLLESFARFALEGRGTPAPVFPTQRLVVSGLYRYVRNPMYLAVLSIILGQALLFGSGTIVGYGALVGLGFHLFVLLYEEPTLRRTYGEEYARYRAHVRRWRPRLRRYEA
ncbi:MAG TPA: isoprenylcysteine carboxylmethyltransferase family protein [Vicinamibacteria bacterium]